MKRETKIALNKLAELCKQSQESLYHRIRLAVACLDDIDYLAEVHGGDQDKAAGFLEGKYFSDLACAVPLIKVAAIYRANPVREHWESHKYNLVSLNAHFEQQREKDKGPQPPRRTATLAQLDAAAAKIADLEYSVSREQSTAQRMAVEIAELRSEVARLMQENAILRGRIMELERRPVAA